MKQMRLRFEFHFIALLLFVSISATAQSAQYGKNLQDHLLIKSNEKLLNGAPTQTTQGSPYLQDAFLDGKVQTNKGNYKVPMRYDIYNDQIEFKQNNQLFILDPDPQVIQVTMGSGEVMVVGKYRRLKGREFGFFTRVDSGRLTLLIKQTTVFKEAELPKALQSSATPASYSRSPDIHFYRIGTGEIVKISSLKKLIASLPDKQEEVSEFVKQEGISAKKTDELVKLVQYYNSLQ